MWHCPEDLETALWEAARSRLGDGPLRGSELVEAVVARSRLYTSDRSELAVGPGAPERRHRDSDLAARALFFTVADVAKVMVPLAELAARGLLPEGPLRVADVGAGVGAMSFGLLATVTGRPVTVDAFDRDRAALELFEVALGSWMGDAASGVELRARVADAGRLELSPGYDLILCGSLLNELGEPAEQGALVDRMIAGLEPHGSLILVEPALRSTARALHRLRDRLLESGRGSVFAPCVRSQSPCPALADPDDWCHEDRPTQLPPRAARLAAATGLRQHGLKFAYLVVRRDGAPRVEQPKRAARVVSQPRKLKGRRECFVCSDAGRVRLRLLKRNRSEENRAFEAAERGDVLCFAAPRSELPAAEPGRHHAELGPDQPVTVDRVG